MHLHRALGCFYTFFYTLRGGYVKYCRVLKQPFHHSFLLTCICSRNWFFSLCPFFPLQPSSLPSSPRLLKKVEQAAGCFRLQRCSKCGVSQTKTPGSSQLWTHLQEASKQGMRMELLHSPHSRLSVYLSVCKSESLLLNVVKRHVPFLLFTFSHSLSLHTPSVDPPVCPCCTHWLSFYIVPCCSLCALRWDCHGYCDLLWGWQRGWKP